MTGDQLRAMRDAAGWTQARLAKRLCVDVMTVSRWERGVRGISLAMAKMVRMVLHRKGNHGKGGRAG